MKIVTMFLTIAVAALVCASDGRARYWWQNLPEWSAMAVAGAMFEFLAFCFAWSAH